MPIYVGQIGKQLTGVPEQKPWVNTYHMETVDETTALNLMLTQAGREMAVTWSIVRAYRTAVRQDSPLASAGLQAVINVQGQRGVTDEQFLPLFNTVRVVFSDGIGRPDQKYLRLPVFEGEQSLGALSSSLLTLIQDEYVTPTVGDPLIVSSSGANYISGTVIPVVQMRQRGWHRRTRPGFVRGWVPVGP